MKIKEINLSLDEKNLNRPKERQIYEFIGEDNDKYYQCEESLNLLKANREKDLKQIRDEIDLVNDMILVLGNLRKDEASIDTDQKDD